MLKNTHIKTIMTFLIIGITIITTLCIYQMEVLKQLNIECTSEILNQKISDTTKLTVVLDSAYSLLCLVIAFVTSKLVDKPITKLLKDANKVTQKAVTKEIALTEPTSQAELVMDNTNLSTVTTNKDVKITAILKTNTLDCNLYKNPTGDKKIGVSER